MPSITRVSACCDGATVDVQVIHYSGSLQVAVIGSNGRIVASSFTEVSEETSLAIDVSSFPADTYTIIIVLDNAMYSGMFDV